MTGTDRTDIDADVYQKRLERLLTNLEALTGMTEDSRKPVELDQTTQGRLSRMDALQVQAMQEATNERRMQDRQRVLAALKRLEDGDFGYCVLCDEEIPVKRLDHDPATPTCIECAKG